MIIGHKKQWAFLQKLAEGGNFSHAYLFSGPEKLGKKTLALEWLSLMFGQPAAAAGERFHPDLILIKPEAKEIQIAQIRELIWRLSLKPYSAPFKAAIIDQAHLMNEEAQGSLLKTLEEPRGNTILILISEYPDYLLSTILSRVERLKFHPVENEEIVHYLRFRKVPEELFGKISEISMGRPGRVVELISDTKKIEALEQKIKELVKILNSDISLRFQYAKLLSKEDPQELRENLDIWLNYFRNILLKEIKGEQAPVRYSLSKLKNILKLIQSVKYLISNTNVNSRLSLEMLMMEI